MAVENANEAATKTKIDPHNNQSITKKCCQHHHIMRSRKTHIGLDLTSIFL
jgi:cytochrome c2